MGRKQKFGKRWLGRKWLITAILLFFLSMALSLVFARISVSSSVEAMQLTQQGRERYQASQFEEVAKAWQQATELFASEGDRLNQAMALSNLSLTYQQLGKWEAADRALNQSLTLLESQSESRERSQILAGTLDVRGQLQLSLGQTESALESWQKTADIYASLEDREGETKSRINQAQALQELGLYPRACKTLQGVLTLSQQGCRLSEVDLERITALEASPVEVLGLQSLGNVLRVVGAIEQSQLVLSASWQLARELGDDRNLPAIYLGLGNTARALGNRQIQQEPSQNAIASSETVDCVQVDTSKSASEFYQQAASCYRQAALSDSATIGIQAQLNLLSLLVQTQQWDEILPVLSEIQANRDRLPIGRTAINAELKLAQNLICLRSHLIPNPVNNSSAIAQQCPLTQQEASGNAPLSLSQIPSWQNITKMFNATLDRARSLGDRQAEAQALGYLGGTYQQMGELAEAQQFTEEALQQVSAFDAPEIAYLWQWQLGRLYRVKGNTENAIAAYTLAFQSLQSLRQDLVATSPDIQFTFRDGVEPVYRELVDLLLEAEHPSQENLQQAREIVEALQLAELNNFFREACLETQSQPIDRIDPKAAVIYSIILPERLAVIVSLPGEPLEYFSTPVEAETIERTFEDLFANLNPFISSPEPLKPHQQFYDWLIRPIESQLGDREIETLVFVLDGVLRGIPMAALHDGEQYLVERYNIALTPGLQLLDSRSLSPDRLNTLAAGLVEARQGFSALPGVEQEVSEIGRIVSTEILLNADFTRDRLKREIEATPFPVVHLATHGQFSSQADNTFLLTWDERINVKDLDGLLQERDRDRQNPIELLILSACQTAVGDNHAALGLAGIAVRSGARSTLATLWAVQDKSTADLMTQFYLGLKESGMTKAQALRQAQLSLLRSPRYQHPFYWSAFVLVGSWL